MTFMQQSMSRPPFPPAHQGPAGRLRSGFLGVFLRWGGLVGPRWTLLPVLAAWSVLSLGCAGVPQGEITNVQVQDLNAALAELARKDDCAFLDTYSILLGSDGKPQPSFYEGDGEHLSDLGYLRWSGSILTPYLRAHQVGCAGMVGDSITRRVNVVKVNQGTEDATWSDLLGIKAYNQGVDGETSEDVLRRVDSLVQPDVDCYFLMIGNNDLHGGIPLPETLTNVEAIVHFLSTRSGKPVVIQAVMPVVE